MPSLLEALHLAYEDRLDAAALLHAGAGLTPPRLTA